MVDRVVSSIRPGSSVDGTWCRPDAWKRQLTAAGVLQVRVADAAARSGADAAHLQRGGVGAGRAVTASRRPLSGARVIEISLAASL